MIRRWPASSRTYQTGSLPTRSHIRKPSLGEIEAISRPMMVGLRVWCNLGRESRRVESASAQALAGGPVNREIVLNLLIRQRQPPTLLNIRTP